MLPGICDPPPRVLRSDVELKKLEPTADMKPRTLLSLIVLAAIVTFTALNWDAIMMPTSLSLGFATFTAPVGLVLLGILGVVTAWLLAYVFWLRHSARLAAGAQAQKLEVQRELADRAEASRYTQLREFLTAETQVGQKRDDDAHAAIVTRLDRIEDRLKAMHPGDLEIGPTSHFEPVLAEEG